MYKATKLIWDGTHCDRRLTILLVFKAVNDQQMTLGRGGEWRQMAFRETKRTWLSRNYMRGCFDVRMIWARIGMKQKFKHKLKF